MTTKAVAPKRKERTPVGGKRDILTVSNQDPNYVYRWVNDTPGRLQRFIDGGYEVVTHEADVGGPTVDKTSRLGSSITKSVGGTVTAVLMRIPREWYEEDQKTKQAAIDELESTMQPDEADYGSIRFVGRNRK